MKLSVVVIVMLSSCADFRAHIVVQYRPSVGVAMYGFNPLTVGSIFSVSLVCGRRCRVTLLSAKGSKRVVGAFSFAFYGTRSLCSR